MLKGLMDKLFGSESESTKIEGFVGAWLQELEKAKEREKDFRKAAKEAVKIYEPEEESAVPFNILFSNTETLLPSLYNNTPRPVVNRRYKTPNEVATMGARVLESFLTYQLDTNGRDYPAFDDLIQSAVLQGLVPGRGVVWFKYKPTLETVTEEDENGESTSYEQVTAQQVCWETVAWDNFLYGYAEAWEHTPWVARIRFMSKAEVEKEFPDAQDVVYGTAKEGSEDSSTSRDEASKDVKLATVYEIWDKNKKEVIFIAEGTKTPLRVVPDPLKLSGFFPCPKPLTFYRRNKSQTPLPIYEAYKSQADELNRITKRITELTKMLKVRGFYDGSLEGIEDVLKAEDGALIPVANVASMAQGTTLEKSIWLMPIQEVIVVLQQLHVQRDHVKQTIYEITGIADIMRGSSVASETLGAQEIKNQWGTLRLKRMQKAVNLYVRECLRITVEIASMQFSAETFAAVTGFDLPTREMKQGLQMRLQQAQAQGQQVPEQAAQQIQQFLSIPSWEDIIEFFQNDPMRQYQIDVETNSTVDIEATEDKAQVGEFLNAMAQFLNGITPIVQQGVLPPDAAKSIMMAVVKRFRFGVEVEESLKAMTTPPPQDDGKDKMQAEVAAAQAQTMVQSEQLKQQSMQMEMQIKQQEHQLQMEELQLKREIMLQKAQIDRDKMLLQAQLAEEAPSKKESE